MQAIVSTIIPCTNTKPTRVKAQSASGLKIVRPIALDEDCDQALRNCARELADKWSWRGRWVSGGLNKAGDEVFVCDSGERFRVTD